MLYYMINLIMLGIHCTSQSSSELIFLPTLCSLDFSGFVFFFFLDAIKSLFEDHCYQYISDYYVFYMTVTMISLKNKLRIVIPHHNDCHSH